MKRFANPRSVIALRITTCLLAAGLSAASSRFARAGVLEGIGGWEGDTRAQGYGFATLGALIPASQRTIIPVRVTASYLYYHYDSTAITLKVRSPGVSLVTGVRVSGTRGSITALAGGEVRWERRAPDVGGAPSYDQTIGGFVGQWENDLVLARRWHGQLLASYGGAAQYVYCRGALRYQVSNLSWNRPVSLFCGLEAVRQGNRDSNGLQAGAFLESSLVPQHVSLGLHGGYKENWSAGLPHATGGYLGLGVYRSY